MALERLGTPTVLICTDVFAGLAEVIARQAGLPTIRIAEVEHPIGGQPPQQIAAKADAVVKSVVAHFVGDAAG